MPAGAVGLAVTAYGASQARKSSKDASKAMTNAADQANQFDWKMFQQSRQDVAPWRAAGASALNEYMALLGLDATAAMAQADPASAYLQANPDVAADSYYGQNPLEHYQRHGRSEGRAWGAPAGTQTSTGFNPQLQQQAQDRFRNTPGYQFGFNEGQRAIESSAAASGGLFSGKAAKSLLKFGTDYADQQGYRPYANSLASAAGLGQVSATQTGDWAMRTAGNFGQNTMNGGLARASGLIGSAGATSSGLAGLAGTFNDWWGSRDKSLNGGWYLGKGPGRG
ncbi:hypothetical protein ABU614_19785 [Lysobacter firmicutimachus]|uniref:DNA transfer protein p32 n=1 Tax=Lysobacter firmicutimachus TaxID=1792846 RepID=A0AAU8MSM9_9GAMM